MKLRKVTFLFFLFVLSTVASSLTEEDDYNDILDDDKEGRTTPPLDDLPSFFGRIVGPKTLMRGQFSRMLSNWMIEVTGYIFGGKISLA